MLSSCKEIPSVVVVVVAACCMLAGLPACLPCGQRNSRAFPFSLLFSLAPFLIEPGGQLWHQFGRRRLFFLLTPCDNDVLCGLCGASTDNSNRQRGEKRERERKTPSPASGVVGMTAFDFLTIIPFVPFRHRPRRLHRLEPSATLSPCVTSWKRFC